MGGRTSACLGRQRGSAMNRVGGRPTLTYFDKGKATRHICAAAIMLHSRLREGTGWCDVELSIDLCTGLGSFVGDSGSENGKQCIGLSEESDIYRSRTT